MNTHLLKKYFWLSLVGLLPLSFVACSDDDELVREPEIINPSDKDSSSNEQTYYTFSEAYINQFCYDQMSFYYLWWKDINVGEWLLKDNPINKVNSILYEEDEWSAAIENIKPYTDPSTTTYGTYGYEFIYLVDKDDTNKVLGVVVQMVYPGSSAEKAGLKRGSVILKLNGKDLQRTNEEYNNLRSSESLNLTVYNPETEVTEEIKMASTDMYLDPVLYEKIFDCGGKKVGYVFFNDYTFECMDRLLEVAKSFKKEGVSELVLDLRYNGGGYVITEEFLVSLLAPEENVKNGDLYQTAVYNDTEYSKLLKEYYGDDYANTYFKTKFEWNSNGKDYSYDTSDANIGLNKIYALVSQSTASASEATLVSLMPFMDVEVIGVKTSGKHCAGIMFEAEDYYQDYEDYLADLKKNNLTKYNQFVDEFWKYYAGWKNYVGNWGLYVMVSTYADKDGNNPCRPDGIIPDLEIMDNPLSPYPLGDDRETLLREALTKAGYTNFTPMPEDIESRSIVKPSLGEFIPSKTEGKRILLKPEIQMNKSSKLLK